MEKELEIKIEEFNKRLDDMDKILIRLLTILETNISKRASGDELIDDFDELWEQFD